MAGSATNVPANPSVVRIGPHARAHDGFTNVVRLTPNRRPQLLSSLAYVVPGPGPMSRRVFRGLVVKR